jgi:hypothetical protein
MNLLKQLFANQIVENGPLMAPGVFKFLRWVG